MRAPKRLSIQLFALVAASIMGLSACGSSSSASDGPKDKASELRLGYFPNLTHAAAVAGVQNGIFASNLGSVALKTSTFNAGPAAVEALLSGAIDASYVGPNPAINAYSKSNGAVKIIAGATSGGAALIVKPDINSAADLKGKKIASPQLGNTQDVALRTWLGTQNLKTDTSGGGDVHVVPQENAQTLQTFQTNDIQGAWVPEPWATRLVQEGGGKVLVNEKDLWPNGQFATTVLVVRTDFAKSNPGVVQNLLKGHLAATELVNGDAAAAQTAVNAGLQSITGKPISNKVITEAWKNLTFTNDPVISSIKTGADNAEALGLVKDTDLSGIADLTALNALLKSQPKAEVPTT